MNSQLKVFLGAWRMRLNRGLARWGLTLAKTRELRQLTVSALIEHFFAHERPVVFLQVGAHDGKSDDHLVHLRSRPNWQGMLLEPNPAVFLRLLENVAAAGNPRVKAVQVAIAEADSTLPFYIVADHARARYSALPAHVDQWSSLSRQKLVTELGEFGIGTSAAGEIIREVKVEALTFNTFLRQHGLEKLDLLLIDAEGLDARLLKMFPLEQHLPRMVVCEWDKMAAEEIDDLLNRFAVADYVWWFIGGDMVLVHHSCLRPRPSLRARTESCSE